MKSMLTVIVLASVPTLNAQVTEEWVTRYDGAGNGDYANSIAIDVAGNVYVTGESETNGIRRDYVTVKYDPSGAELWTARYNGAANYIDQAYDVAVDGSGNVYVTGGSQGIGTERDFCTVKYNSNGDSLWVRRYNGPGNNIDESIAVFVDGSGNVYVTGYSDGGINLDYCTIKYDSSGTEQWISRYDGPATGTGSEDRPHALEVDESGNVYITGESNTGFGFLDLYATVKYNPAGDTLWVARYKGPGPEGLSQAYDLAVDMDGNVYVTGRSDPSSGFGFNFDILTIKYDSDGEPQWVERYNGSGNSSDVANSIALDSDGNVFVTGLTVETSTADYCTIKYHPGTGEILWLATYNGPANSVDAAYSIAVDASGNSYVTGYSEGLGTNNDYATIRYDPTGTEEWVQRYNGPGNSADAPASLVIDGAGNVYVTGESNGVASALDYATIKYSQSDEIPCGDIARLQARCGPGGAVKARIILDNILHAGESIEFKVDDDIYEATIVSSGNRSRAQIEVAGYSIGNHTVSLENPQGCFDPIAVTCSGGQEGLEDQWEENDESPPVSSLEGNYPNPFNPSTTFRFELSDPGQVSLKVYSMLGQHIKTLVDGFQEKGYYQVTWDGRNEIGSVVAGGIYLYRIVTADYTETRKMLMMK